MGIGGACRSAIFSARQNAEWESEARERKRLGGCKLIKVRERERNREVERVGLELISKKKKKKK